MLRFLCLHLVCLTVTYAFTDGYDSEFGKTSSGFSGYIKDCHTKGIKPFGKGPTSFSKSQVSQHNYGDMIGAFPEKYGPEVSTLAGSGFTSIPGYKPSAYGSLQEFGSGYIPSVSDYDFGSGLTSRTILGSKGTEFPSYYVGNPFDQSSIQPLTSSMGIASSTSPHFSGFGSGFVPQSGHSVSNMNNFYGNMYGNFDNYGLASIHGNRLSAGLINGNQGFGNVYNNEGNTFSNNVDGRTFLSGHFQQMH